MGVEGLCTKSLMLNKIMFSIHCLATSSTAQGENYCLNNWILYYVSLHIQDIKSKQEFHQANCLSVTGSKLFSPSPLRSLFFLIKNRVLVSQRDMHSNLQLNCRPKLSIFHGAFFTFCPSLPLSSFSPNCIIVPA